MWATHPDDPQESLCFGTTVGYMVLWQQGPRESNFKDFLAKRLTQGGEVIVLACNTSGDTKVRIAVSTRDKIVQVWNYDPKEVLHPVFLVELGVTIPRHLGFADNVTQDIYVFGLFNGQMQMLRGNDSKIISIHKVSQRIGSAAISDRHNQFVVDNNLDGFSLHQLDDDAYIWVPKQVAFGEDSKVIVGGSDHGAMYVFDRRMGATLDVLHHTDEGLVQTLTTHDNAGKSMIITASSGFCHKSSICLWAHIQHKEKPVMSLKRHWTLGSVIKYIWYMFINLTILLAAGAFVYQNLNVWSIKSIYMAMGKTH
ncbi:hypothetical protein BU17DRAFT_72065 [Hysterangium stoloniferum]|nr:hypothetical protein BU17DRAFT_72065 [Hysterangium stoloniferum]